MFKRLGLIIFFASHISVHGFGVWRKKRNTPCSDHDAPAPIYPVSPGYQRIPAYGAQFAPYYGVQNIYQGYIPQPPPNLPYLQRDEVNGYSIYPENQRSNSRGFHQYPDQVSKVKMLQKQGVRQHQPVPLNNIELEKRFDEIPQEADNSFLYPGTEGIPSNQYYPGYYFDQRGQYQYPMRFPWDNTGYIQYYVETMPPFQFGQTWYPNGYQYPYNQFNNDQVSEEFSKQSQFRPELPITSPNGEYDDKIADDPPSPKESSTILSPIQSEVAESPNLDQFQSNPSNNPIVNENSEILDGADIVTMLQNNPDAARLFKEWMRSQTSNDLKQMSYDQKVIHPVDVETPYSQSNQELSDYGEFQIQPAKSVTVVENPSAPITSTEKNSESASSDEGNVETSTTETLQKLSLPTEQFKKESVTIPFQIIPTNLENSHTVNVVNDEQFSESNTASDTDDSWKRLNTLINLKINQNEKASNIVGDGEEIKEKVLDDDKTLDGPIIPEYTESPEKEILAAVPIKLEPIVQITTDDGSAIHQKVVYPVSTENFVYKESQIQPDTSKVLLEVPVVSSPIGRELETEAPIPQSQKELLTITHSQSRPTKIDNSHEKNVLENLTVDEGSLESASESTIMSDIWKRPNTLINLKFNQNTHPENKIKSVIFTHDAQKADYPWFQSTGKQPSYEEHQIQHESSKVSVESPLALEPFGKKDDTEAPIQNFKEEIETMIPVELETTNFNHAHQHNKETLSEATTASETNNIWKKLSDEKNHKVEIFDDGVVHSHLIRPVTHDTAKDIDDVVPIVLAHKTTDDDSVDNKFDDSENSRKHSTGKQSVEESQIHSENSKLLFESPSVSRSVGTEVKNEAPIQLLEELTNFDDPHKGSKGTSSINTVASEKSDIWERLNTPISSEYILNKQPNKVIGNEEKTKVERTDDEVIQKSLNEQDTPIMIPEIGLLDTRHYEKKINNVPTQFEPIQRTTDDGYHVDTEGSPHFQVRKEFIYTIPQVQPESSIVSLVEKTSTKTLPDVPLVTEVLKKESVSVTPFQFGSANFDDTHEHSVWKKLNTLLTNLKFVQHKQPSTVVDEKEKNEVRRIDVGEVEKTLYEPYTSTILEENPETEIKNTRIEFKPLTQRTRFVDIVDPLHQPTEKQSIHEVTQVQAESPEESLEFPVVSEPIYKEVAIETPIQLQKESVALESFQFTPSQIDDVHEEDIVVKNIDDKDNSGTLSESRTSDIWKRLNTPISSKFVQNKQSSNIVGDEEKIEIKRISNDDVQKTLDEPVIPILLKENPQITKHSEKVLETIEFKPLTQRPIDDTANEKLYIFKTSQIQPESWKEFLESPRVTEPNSKEDEIEAPIQQFHKDSVSVTPLQSTHTNFDDSNKERVIWKNNDDKDFFSESVKESDTWKALNNLINLRRNQNKQSSHIFGYEGTPKVLITDKEEVPNAKIDSVVVPIELKQLTPRTADDDSVGQKVGYVVSMEETWDQSGKKQPIYEETQIQPARSEFYVEVPLVSRSSSKELGSGEPIQSKVTKHESINEKEGEVTSNEDNSKSSFESTTTKNYLDLPLAITHFKTESVTVKPIHFIPEKFDDSQKEVVVINTVDKPTKTYEYWRKLINLVNSKLNQNKQDKDFFAQKVEPEVQSIKEESVYTETRTEPLESLHFSRPVGRKFETEAQIQPKIESDAKESFEESFRKTIRSEDESPETKTKEFVIDAFQYTPINFDESHEERVDDVESKEFSPISPGMNEYWKTVLDTLTHLKFNENKHPDPITGIIEKSDVKNIDDKYAEEDFFEPDTLRVLETNQHVLRPFKEETESVIPIEFNSLTHGTSDDQIVHYPVEVQSASSDEDKVEPLIETKTSKTLSKQPLVTENLKELIKFHDSRKEILDDGESEISSPTKNDEVWKRLDTLLHLKKTNHPIIISGDEAKRIGDESAEKSFDQPLTGSILVENLHSARELEGDTGSRVPIELKTLTQQTTDEGSLGQKVDFPIYPQETETSFQPHSALKPSSEEFYSEIPIQSKLPKVASSIEITTENTSSDGEDVGSLIETITTKTLLKLPLPTKHFEKVVKVNTEYGDLSESTATNEENQFWKRLDTLLHLKFSQNKHPSNIIGDVEKTKVKILDDEGTQKTIDNASTARIESTIPIEHRSTNFGDSRKENVIGKNSHYEGSKELSESTTANELWKNLETLTHFKLAGDGEVAKSKTIDDNSGYDDVVKAEVPHSKEMIESLQITPLTQKRNNHLHMTQSTGESNYKESQVHSAESKIFRIRTLGGKHKSYHTRGSKSSNHGGIIEDSNMKTREDELGNQDMNQHFVKSLTDSSLLTYPHSDRETLETREDFQWGPWDYYDDMDGGEAFGGPPLEKLTPVKIDQA